MVLNFITLSVIPGQRISMVGSIRVSIIKVSKLTCFTDFLFY